MSLQAVPALSTAVTIDGTPTLDGRALGAQDLPPVEARAIDRWADLARGIRGQFSIIAKSVGVSIGVTDLTGSYPVYMAARGGKMKLSGRLHELAPASGPMLNREAAARFVGFMATGAGPTLIDGIGSLGGASIALCDGPATRIEDTRIKGWFDWPSLAYNTPAPFEELEAEFKAIMTSWAEVFLPKTGRIGLLLSGGTDSAVMAAVLAPLLGDRLVAITQDSISKKYSERDAAAETAAATGVPLLAAKLGRSHYFQALRELNSATQDDPIPFGEALNLYRLAAYARERGIHTLLTGSNADCLFLGLDCYFAGFPRGNREYADTVGRYTNEDKLFWLVGNPPAFTSFDRELLDELGVPEEIYHDTVQRFLSMRRRRIEPIAPLVDYPTLQKIEFAMDGGFCWHGRQGALPVMRALPGTSVLCPFYDPQMIKFAIKLPKELAMHDGETKYFLRQVLKRMTGLHRTKRAGSLSPLRYWRTVPHPREAASVAPGLRKLYRRMTLRNWEKLGGLYNDVSKLAALGSWMNNHGVDVRAVR